jgi:hypothetical protein
MRYSVCVTTDEKRALDRKIEQMVEGAGVEPGMTFEQAIERLQTAGFDEISAAKWAAFLVEAHEQAPA